MKLEVFVVNNRSSRQTAIWTSVVFADTCLGVVEHCGQRNLDRVITYLKFINFKLKMASRQNDSANLCSTCIH